MQKTNRLSAVALLNASPQTQKTYLGDYITAVTTISGATQSQTSTTFNNSAGPFIPPNNIILNPQNLIEEGIELQSGQQKLRIIEIRLTPPNQEQEGYVSLKSEFTDIYGDGKKSFVGIIADWIPGIVPVCTK